MENNREGKYLILCGFAHVNEGTCNPWNKAKAQRLKDTAGLDPITINQAKPPA